MSGENGNRLSRFNCGKALFTHTHKNVQSHRFKEDLMKGDEGKIVKPQIDSSQRRRMHFAKNFLLV